jgi:hypothetical protein
MIIDKENVGKKIETPPSDAAKQRLWPMQSFNFSHFECFTSCQISHFFSISSGHPGISYTSSKIFILSEVDIHIVYLWFTKYLRVWCEFGDKVMGSHFAFHIWSIDSR